MSQNQKPPFKPTVPPPARLPNAGVPLTRPQVAPSKELDKPTNSLMLTKTKPMELIDGKHPFEDKIARKKTPHYTFLFFGPSGSGKTSVIGSAAFDPRTSPMLVLSADASSRSLRGIPDDLLTSVDIETWEDINEAWDFLMFRKHNFKSVALDGITDLHIYSMLTIMESKTEATERRGDPTQAEQSDYGNSMAQMRKILILFKRLPLHLFVTAQPKVANIPRVGSCQVPSMFGQMAMELAGAFDVCAYTSSKALHDTKMNPTANPTLNSSGEDVSRFVYFQNTPQIIAKVRTDWAKRCKDFVQVSQKDAMTTILNTLGM